MTIAAWPVATRSRLVRAFRPGEPSSAEGPFRTLRSHRWATAGVRVTRRAAGRLGGQLTLFSSLNVDAARLARLGVLDAAGRLAYAAATLEGGPDFARLRTLLATLPTEAALNVVDGVLPPDAPTDLADTLRALAHRTDQRRAQERALGTSMEVMTGRIIEVHDHYVLLSAPDQPTTLVPRWMATTAHRTHVGDPLALLLDRLGDATAVIEAVPAIDTDAPPFTPFGRADPRTRTITTADEHLLTGQPEPPLILVPVQIDA
jgi:hypothetical protein